MLRLSTTLIRPFTAKTDQLGVRVNGKFDLMKVRIAHFEEMAIAEEKSEYAVFTCMVNLLADCIVEWDIIDDRKPTWWKPWTWLYKDRMAPITRNFVRHRIPSYICNEMMTALNEAINNAPPECMR